MFSLPLLSPTMMMADVTTATLFAVVLLLSWLCCRATLPRRPPGAPPGPNPAVPLLGHLHLLRDRDPRRRFDQWRKAYGDVFSFCRGSQLVVVLNGHGVIREAFVKHADVFSVRPSSFLVDVVCGRMGESSISVMPKSSPSDPAPSSWTWWVDGWVSRVSLSCRKSSPSHGTPSQVFTLQRKEKENAPLFFIVFNPLKKTHLLKHN